MIDADALEQAREDAESLLIDDGEVTRPVKPGPFDPLLGEHDPPGGMGVVAETALRVQPQTVRERRVVVGDEVQVRRVYHCSLPLNVDVRVGDVVTVTVSADDWLVGRPLKVVDVVGSAVPTVRRLVVEDVAAARPEADEEDEEEGES